MEKSAYKYIIAGAGLAGASAIEGIRDLDKDNPIVVFGDEKYLPYDRPPLSKKLWTGQMQKEGIFINEPAFYEENKVELKIGVSVTAINPAKKNVTDSSGNEYKYEKLLLATGGRPRVLPIPGGDLDGISYYRYLDDYERIRAQAQEGKSALVIGGGFIGSEIAAALNLNKIKVSMLFPESYICKRVFPDYLSEAIQAYYIQKGVEVLSEDKPLSIEKNEGKFLTRTEKGKEKLSDILIVGIGLSPEIKLAVKANLKTDNGIVVNEFLQTSAPDIYAAGDNCFFPCKALGRSMRVEHWDNALKQGKHAGENMAGGGLPFDYIPYFFSDLFEFGYEAAGEIDSSLKTFADWQEENRKGVIYYLKDDLVRGVMLCNVWKKVGAARKLILKGERVTEDTLRGAIK
ncbi:MAG: FAD-dependent oxidoreductase [Candidatus Omnitrophica bacterium]|nr:FAD-dependent oxidoreductase [Candidatus Omnitrophota bacterium]